MQRMMALFISESDLPRYGRLSPQTARTQTQTENSAGELNDADEYDRESTSDFALWKSRKMATAITIGVVLGVKVARDGT